MKLSLAALVPLLVLVAGCGAGGATTSPPVVATLPPRPLAQSQTTFDAALAAFARHDEAHDWTPGACGAVAAMFDDVRAPRGPLAALAAFDAGLAWQRCGDDAHARDAFGRSAKADPTFSAAQAKLALYRYREEPDVAIDLLERAVAQGQFRDVASLVDLAAMQMARDHAAPGNGCANDMACAKLNLHRALALDDAYMPAHDQLALHYLQTARKHPIVADGKVRPNVHALDLGLLVCTQAIAKRPRYAPIYNTMGLIEGELGRVNDAAFAFGRAVELDPKSFEAQMNYAALNLGFRGFTQAQGAYRQAIAIRPNDYDAHLGMAVALRGPIVDEPDAHAHRAKIDAALAEIAAAKRIDADRPDAWFNQGVLIHELESRGETPAESRAALDRAEAAFRAFLEKARARRGYEGAIARANDRLKDIDVTRQFLK